MLWGRQDSTIWLSTWWAVFTIYPLKVMEDPHEWQAIRHVCKGIINPCLIVGSNPLQVLFLSTWRSLSYIVHRLSFSFGEPLSSQISFKTTSLLLFSSNVRVANSKPELSQLLFISVRQRELVKSSHWIWSIYLYRFYLVCALVSHTTMWPVTRNLWHHVTQLWPWLLI